MEGKVRDNSNDAFFFDQFDVPSVMLNVSQRITAKKLYISECEEIFHLMETVQDNVAFSAIIKHAQDTTQSIYTNLEEVWKFEQFWKLSPQ